jgi:uncharacterized membrane protein required for colicin V production
MFIDVLLLLILVAIIFLCFSKGLIKVSSVLLGMYLGLQVAALFYKLFGALTAEAGNDASIRTNQVIWFGILWVVWSIIFSLVVMSFTKEYRMPEKWGNLDQIGGLVVGLLVGIFGVLVMAYVIRNTVTLAWIAAGRPSNYLYAIKSGFDTSILMGVFNSIKVLFLNVLSPWLPSGEIPVFQNF